MEIVGKQFGITPAAGKRLIARGVAAHPVVREALQQGRRIVIVAGTTNGYVAEELLSVIGQASGFEKRCFFRGVTLPPAFNGALPGETDFPGDVIIENGRWLKGKTIFDILPLLKKGDIIIKGANALSLPSFKPALYIGHPESGTIGAALPVVIGKKLRLIVPVGLEKRISGDLDAIARRINAPGTEGPRMLTLQETAYTEIQALSQLSGTRVELVGGGGIAGAEGLCRLLAEGSAEAVNLAVQIVDAVKEEPSFQL